MKQAKKKRSRSSKRGDLGKQGLSSTAAVEEKRNILSTLLEVFASATLEQAASAYKEANGDPDKAAEILAKVRESTVQEDQSTMCSCSSGNYFVGFSSSSNGSDLFGDGNDFMGHGFKNKNKQKTIAAAGTVSTMLGKDYVRSTPKKSCSKLKEFHEENWSKEEGEQFLCSMLGDESELGLAVVRDVLCQCGYILDKALDILLELSVSSKEQVNGCSGSMATSSEDVQYILESHDSLIDSTSDSTSRSSETEYQDNVWFKGNLLRGPSKVSGSNKSLLSSETGNCESVLPQEVLASLFSMPTPKSAEHESNTMNWRNVVKQMVSLGPKSEGGIEKGQPLNAKREEYQVLRTTASQHWDSMKCYYQKATTAFSNGNKEYAAYLSEKGRLQNKMARDADEKASQDIFSARNRRIENMITIDLHGQHIKQAMKLLKLHLLFGSYVRSVQLFRVITGCGSHGLGKSKLKLSVIELLKREGINWSEENKGTLLIRLNGQTDFSFLDSDSDDE